MRPGHAFRSIADSRVRIGSTNITASTAIAGGLAGGNRLSFSVSGGMGIFRMHPESRGPVTVEAHLRVYETAVANARTWGPSEKDRLVWEGTLSDVLPPACSPDASRGAWGDVRDGLRSRLVLGQRSCRPGQGLSVYLDVRNDTGGPLEVLAGDALSRHFLLIGPDGRTVPRAGTAPDRDAVGSWSVESGGELSAVYLDTSTAYRLVEPGLYLVEWPACGPVPNQRGLPPPPARPVSFMVIGQGGE
jgi:hypothetical protein